jgi:hypothetical protein
MDDVGHRPPCRARPRHRAAPVALAVAGLVLAGCGGGSGTRTVARLPGRAAAAASGPAALTVSRSDADMVACTRCMRARGVQMRDPFHRAGHQGLTLDVPPPDSANRTAFDACSGFIKAIVQAKQQGATAEAAPHLAALTSYAQCMRGRDIDMLDPTPQGQLNLGHVPGITAVFGRYSPQFRAADAACRHLLPAGVHDDGTGP